MRLDSSTLFRSIPMNWILYVILPAVCIILGWTICWLYVRFQLSASEQRAERILQEAIKDAEAQKKEFKDSDRLGERLAEKLNKEISGGKFVLSEEKAKIKGGLLLKNGPVYTNGSIETLVEERYDELSSEVAAILFDD